MVGYIPMRISRMGDLSTLRSEVRAAIPDDVIDRLARLLTGTTVAAAKLLKVVSPGLAHAPAESDLNAYGTVQPAGRAVPGKISLFWISGVMGLVLDLVMSPEQFQKLMRDVHARDPKTAQSFMRNFIDFQIRSKVNHVPISEAGLAIKRACGTNGIRSDVIGEEGHRSQSNWHQLQRRAEGQITTQANDL